jgi:hypothetical protein
MLIDVLNCSGEVHLEDLHALEHGMFPLGLASIRIRGSTLVTMLDGEGFGRPAVETLNSTVILNACRLGLTSIGLGGGPSLHAVDSTIDIIEPTFRTGNQSDCILSIRSDLRIGGTGLAVIEGGAVFGSNTAAGTAIVTQLGSVTVDPLVQLVSHPSTTPTIVGTATVNITDVPTTRAFRAVPGTNVALVSTVPANSTRLLFVGLPGPLTPTPFGSTLLLQPPLPVVLLAIQSTVPAGVLTAGLAIPAWVPLGFSLAAQGLVITPTAFLADLPCAFTVH